jgi:demethylmenaquinone methyltransferase/2-methoxy-6-polyprenyl-1,4-benzoquinol methylase
MHISRVRRPKITAKRSYDRLSHIYDWLAGSSETQFMHQGLEMLALNANESVLEIGCGTGKALVELCHQAGDQGKVHAIDLSRGMLGKSRSRLVIAGLQQQVSLLEGDGSCLPYRNGSFKTVFISFTLELFDTPEIHCIAGMPPRWNRTAPGSGLHVENRKSQEDGAVIRVPRENPLLTWTAAQSMLTP